MHSFKHEFDMTLDEEVFQPWNDSWLTILTRFYFLQTQEHTFVKPQSWKKMKIMALVPLIVMSFDLPNQKDMMYLEGLSNSYGPRVSLNVKKITNSKSMANSRLVYFRTGAIVEHTTGSVWSRLAGWRINGQMVNSISLLFTLKIHALINESSSMKSHLVEVYIFVSFEFSSSWRTPIWHTWYMLNGHKSLLEVLYNFELGSALLNRTVIWSRLTK